MYVFCISNFTSEYHYLAIMVFFLQADDSVFYKAQEPTNQATLAEQKALFYVLKSLGPELLCNEHHFAHLPAMALTEVYIEFIEFMDSRAIAIVSSSNLITHRH